MLLMILSEDINIFFLILFLFFFISALFVIKPKVNDIDIAFKRFMSIACFIFAGVFGMVLYYINFNSDLNAETDSYRISKISINVQTFKKHEHKLPEEKDFYFSGFLNDSNYFFVNDGEKNFNPLYNSRSTSDFKVINEDNSVSMNYSLDYDKTSFIRTGAAYRYCLNLPIELSKAQNIKGMKVSINGKDFDYKKADKESMKDICYSDKINHYKLTFL